MAMTAKRMFGKLGRHLVVPFVAALLVSAWTVGAARADTITDQNVAAAVAAAKTPADHQALSAFFTAKAEAAQADAEMHEKMAAAFGGKARGVMAGHCKGLIKADHQQVKDYTALAKEQAKLAK